MFLDHIVFANLPPQSLPVLKLLEPPIPSPTSFDDLSDNTDPFAI